MPTRGRFHNKTRHCPLTLSRTRRLPKISLLHRIESSSAVQQRCSSVFVRSLTPASNNQVEPSSGCRHGGDFTTNLAAALGLSSLPVADPRPRCSTKTSRRRTYSSATAPSLSVPNTCKQKTGSTQLGVPTWGQFHNKPRRCPLSLSPTRHPPKTPLLHQNESSLAVR